jgi:hypothetical protein
MKPVSDTFQDLGAVRCGTLPGPSCPVIGVAGFQATGGSTDMPVVVHCGAHTEEL